MPSRVEAARSAWSVINCSATDAASERGHMPNGQRYHRPTRTVITLLGAAVVAAAIGGCGSSSPDQGSQGPPESPSIGDLEMAAMCVESPLIRPIWMELLCERIRR